MMDLHKKGLDGSKKVWGKPTLPIITIVFPPVPCKDEGCWVWRGILKLLVHVPTDGWKLL